MVVAPFTGAWIEIVRARTLSWVTVGVAPFTGAWIEIHPQFFIQLHVIKSHPSRVRGLKSWIMPVLS